jgi:DNA-binding NarL/FixJ family response regulator
VIRVIVAASSTVSRAGLEAVVRSCSDLHLAATIGTDVLDQDASVLDAEVLLLELPLFDDHWITLLNLYSMACVVLAPSPHPALLTAALRTNIRSVITSDASSAEIVAAICSAAAGLIAIQPQVFELISNEPRTLPPAELEEDLTQRELEVLRMLAEGLSNKLIAHGMGISEHTVKFHVAALMAKLHASSRTEAVMQGVRRGLVLI